MLKPVSLGGAGRGLPRAGGHLAGPLEGQSHKGYGGTWLLCTAQQGAWWACATRAESGREDLVPSQPLPTSQDKRFASGKYQDVYVELNHIKTRSEREIEQLKEHLRLAMAALQEKEAMRNSVAE